MQILVDSTTTRFQLACLSKLLLALASDTDFDAIGDLVAPQAKVDPEPIKLIDDAPPAPASPDVDYGRDPLTVMRAAQTGGGVLDLKEEILRRMDQIPTEPPAPPKAARAPRKPKAAAEPPAPIPAIPVPPPVQLSIPMPPQTAPTVPAIPVPPSVSPAQLPAAPVVVTAPSAPMATAGAATITPAPSTFPELMQWAMPLIAAKRIDHTTLTAACNSAGLPALNALIAHGPDKVREVHANIVALMAGGAS